ncbi:Predicted dithiol-disulfide isomerase, DsbA family [Polaromonas sp. OV174]|uniref:DsbA family oxidoreductase n=1 Tax=Polaromonas sp. OV174 TaxID=1855300 RepID=UPI0008EEFF63|nr:DsbA family oxidoreductase [Polaromonas sp. OV174]SFC00133.1 Predicted dithiol-disulfide isomerase, DsbA family [Polaromonas sp. OV174]
MSQELVIDVYVDLICPWCLIGKRHLDQALAELARTDPEVAVEVRWHSVQLLPELPVQGRDFTEFYIQRKGSAQAVRQGQERVQQAALAAGAEVNFAIIARMPNTLLAHQLLAFARTRQTPPQHVQLLERLLAAHFSRGEDLGERATLLAIAQDFDLPLAELSHWLESGMGKPMPLDVPGVPFFVFNQRLALSGAQPPELLLTGMREALEAPLSLRA